MRNPASYLVGILREAILLTLHLPFAAAAIDHDGVHEDPEKRFGTVARYVYSVTYGTKADAERVSGFVRRRHAQVVGTEPVTGDPYQANADYELVLTNVLLSSSFIAAYEAIHGRLTDAERDQYLMEQKVGGALLGIRPRHLPSTWPELEAFLGRARMSWAAGEQAREILKPFASGEYPAGSVIGDLPAHKRKPVAFLVRALTDMALTTMRPEERELLSIDRAPQLRSRRLVRLSLRQFARFFASPRGGEAFGKLLKGDVAKIVRRAHEAEAAAGGHDRAAETFVVPDAEPLVYDLEDRVENMPG
jgi:uncharacterized protein (DUF2236 family)